MNKDAIIRFIRAWRKANDVDAAMVKLGYSNTPCFEIASDLADAIYYLLDEKTRTLDDSVTYKTLSNKNYSDEQCAEILLDEYCNSVPKLSKHVNSSIKEAADLMGISIPAMITVILGEWALQHELLSDRVRSMAN